MPDNFDEKTRSHIMSKIRSKNTSPEVNFRKAMYAAGLRGYRIHPKIYGNPEIAFLGKKVVIYIDGDFWHGYNWKVLGKIPPKNYWQEKIERNMHRDKEYTMNLENDGWKVIRFWEHEIKKDLDKCINNVLLALDSKK